MRRLGVLLLVVAGLFVPAATAFAHPEPGDVDGDGIGDQVDNCPQERNGDQQNTDRTWPGGDLLGDRCDTDADADGVPNPTPYYNDIRPGTDNCPLVQNPGQEMTEESEPFGEACYVDTDGDSHPDPLDNCPDVANPEQEDYDFDRTGDVCDPDDDFDGEFDAVDNCPLVYNWEQTDADGDGIGAACDDDDTPAPPPGPPPGPPPSASAAPDVQAPALRLTMTRTLRLRELGRSIAVEARCSERCTLRADLIVKRRRVASGTAELGGAGTTYVFMRKLRRLRPARATLRLTATDAAGNKRSASKRVRLRR
jgi:hypothetical protein